MDKLSFLALLIILSSCITGSESELEKKNPNQFPQKWELVQMSGNLANMSPDTGSEMAWQEYYLLKSDSTFTKLRTEEDKTVEEKGNYKFLYLRDGKYLELSYASANELIGNCTGEFQEMLRVESEKKLSGTWGACDGPSLFYERTK